MLHCPGGQWFTIHSCINAMPSGGGPKGLKQILLRAPKGLGHPWFQVITSVFFRLMFSPICCTFVFSCICWWVWETSAGSFAKSRFSSVVNSVHLMPLD